MLLKASVLHSLEMFCTCVESKSLVVPHPLHVSREDKRENRETSSTDTFFFSFVRKRKEQKTFTT